MPIATRTGRLLATVLFTDIVGSTKRAAELGDRKWGEILDAHHAAVREQISGHGGEEIATAGDGFFAIFDSPQSAVECARAVRDVVQPLGLEIRAGLHTGECEIMGDNVGGLAVHIGARVSAKAGPSQILVSSTVKDLVAGSAIPFKDRGSHTLKGVPGKWRLYAVDDTPPESKTPAGAPAAVPLPGRALELATIEQEIETTGAGTLRVLCFQGEIGIGKSRLLREASSLAARKGFAVASTAADEEIRGPLLLARTLLGALVRPATDAGAKRALKQANEAVAGGPGDRGSMVPGNEPLVPVFDSITLALRAIAIRKPLAIVLDDIHSADEETLRLVRYIARFAGTSPILFVLAMEPGPGEAANLAADLERLRIGQIFALARLTLDETAQALELALGGKIDPALAQEVQIQGEGVPFNIEELVRSLRDGGLVHAIEGTWSLTSGGAALVPASVRLLVERRAARFGADTRDALSVAAVLGRRFALSSLASVLGILGGNGPPSAARVASLLAPAVEEGVLAELPAGESNDYAFAHNQMRTVLADVLPRERRAAVHAAVVDLLSPGGEPAPERLAEVAYHARLAGEMSTAGRCALAAAKLALDALAPEEAIRLLDTVDPATLEDDRRAVAVRLRDDALASLGLGNERGPVLDQLEVLARSLGDERLAFEVDLRRAAAARLAEDWGRAAEIARSARAAAESRGDKQMVQAACLELGQALIRNQLGESFTVSPTEVDVDAATEAFACAAQIAEDLGDARGVAVAKREMGIVQGGRVKAAFLDYAFSHTLMRLPQGDEWAPIDAQLEVGRKLLGEALEIFEKLDDRRGVMSTIIALSYTHFHSGIRHGIAGVMEKVRRLHIRGADGQALEEEMLTLYGIHYYARFNIYPDLALERGHEAYRASRALGNKWMEFLSAGGVALTHALLNEQKDADSWLDLARNAAMAEPTPIRGRRLELWRGIVRARTGDLAGAIERFERAAELARAGKPPELCEAVATAALELGLLSLSLEGSERTKALQHGEEFAGEALRIAPALPGPHPWSAHAQATRALAFLDRGDIDNALATAQGGFWSLEGRVHLSPQLEPRLMFVHVFEAAGDPFADQAKDQLRSRLQEVVMNILDDDVKHRWFASPVHTGIEAKVGKVPPPPQPTGPGRARLAQLTPRESHILKLIPAGMTNREIAAEIGVPKATIDQDIESIFSKIGVANRGAATQFAVSEGVV